MEQDEAGWLRIEQNGVVLKIHPKGMAILKIYNNIIII